MLTLRELKEKVVAAEKMNRVPTFGTLRKMNIPIVVKEVLGGQTEVTVYENGLVSYVSGNHATVFPLHSCGGYIYGSNMSPEQKLSPEFFENERWYIRLMLEGEDRIVKNTDKREDRNTISYSAVAEDWDALGVEDCLLDALMEAETVECILRPMTEKQRIVMTKHYLEQIGQAQIGADMGISQQAVSDMIRKAICRARKAYQAD